MNSEWWYRTPALPLLGRMSLLGIAILAVFFAAFLRVNAQDSSVEGAASTKAAKNNPSTDSDLVWVDSQVVWEEIRNLFAPQLTVILKRQQQVSSQINSMTRFPTITGIFSTHEGENRAILDGMVVRAGDRLKDFFVKQITNDRVTLQGEETYALELKPHQTPSIKIFLISAPGKGAQEVAVNIASETAGQREGKERKPNVEP